MEEESKEIEKPVISKPRKEFVMTEARLQAVERMKAARALNCKAINDKKAEEKAIIEKAKKKKPAPKKQVIVYDSESSSGEENQIIIRRKRAKKETKPEPELEYDYRDEPPEPPQRLRRL